MEACLTATKNWRLSFCDNLSFANAGTFFFPEKASFANASLPAKQMEPEVANDDPSFSPANRRLRTKCSFFLRKACVRERNVPFFSGQACVREQQPHFFPGKLAFANDTFKFSQGKPTFADDDNAMSATGLVAQFYVSNNNNLKL